MFNWEIRSRTFLEYAGVFFSIASGLFALVIAIMQGKLTVLAIVLIVCFLLFLAPFLYARVRSLKFRKLSEKKFIGSIDFSKVKKLKVLSHTGKVLYSEIAEKLNALLREGKPIPEEVHILTRTRFVESMSRNHYIKSTIAMVKGLREKRGITTQRSGDELIDIRFYETIPSMRGIICEGYGGKIVNFMSAYYWEEANRSKSFDYAFIIKESVNDRKKQTELIGSWFDQYWGRDEIHTIVFDFDDTLIPSMNLQIDAWVQVIHNRYEADPQFAEKLTPRISNHIVQNDGPLIENVNFKDEIRQIFVERQLAEAIVEEIFVDINDLKFLTGINQDRFEIRKNLLLAGTVEPFDYAREKLAELHRYHNFAIITSTDEGMVRDYLSEKGLLNYFSVILGKNDPSLRYERENIYKKTFLLIKLSQIIGIPLDRMIYIGDNNTDYLATRQIGIDFIEARQAAGLIGKNSLIDPRVIKGRRPVGSFTSYNSNQLNGIIEDCSYRRRLKKY